MADFLDEKRKEIQARLKELRPLVDEYHRLEAAEQALSGVGGACRPPPQRRPGAAAAARSGSAPAAAAARAAPARGPRRPSSS